MPKAPKTLLDRIIPLYRKRVLQRAKENEAALRASGAYSPAEFNDLKDRMLKAYRHIGTASAPVMNTNLSNLKKFLKSGEYRNLGSSGVTNGENDVGARLRYSNAMYGYEDLPGAEKYGTVPMDEVSWLSDDNRMEDGLLPGVEYGDWRIHLKPNMKPYATINAFDSINQWPDNAPGLPHRNLMPVPWMPDDHEAYVGALMDVVSPAAEEEFLGMGWTPDAIRNETRVRNDETARLLEGRKWDEYLESQLHGPIYRDDIDFIEVLGNADRESDRDAMRQLGEQYGIRFTPYSEYRSPRPLDTRRELEPRSERFEGWMRRLRR